MHRSRAPFGRAQTRCANRGSRVTVRAQQHPSTVNEATSQPQDAVLDRRAALLAAATTLAASPLAVQAAPAEVIRPFCGVTGVIPLWAYSADWQEGTVEYAGFKTWYRSLGKPVKVRKARSLQSTTTKWPLLVLHGGPGMPSRYLETLELLHGTGRQVVFYDQIGCGKSRAANNGKGPGLQRITPELFIQEVEAVRQGLNLERCHVVGHGWGGLLALAYLLQQQQDGVQGEGAVSGKAGVRPGVKGVLSATLLATPPSWQALIRDRQDKARALGDDVWSALQQDEPGSPAYQAALTQYERAHVYCQQPVTPGCLEVSSTTTSPSISKAMTGSSMFKVGGALADWQLPAGSSAALAGLPVLVARGEREELSPASTQALLEGPLQGAAARLLELPGAGSMVHIDAYEPLLDAMEELMSAAEA